MKKSYILDSNILIDDYECIEVLKNGEENDVYIPYTVVMELDRLKKKSDLKHIISIIADRLENVDDLEVLKIPGKKYTHKSANDDDILEDIKYAVSEGIIKEGIDPIVVTNDKLFRVRLKFEGIKTQEYISSNPFQSESQMYTGFIEEDQDSITNCFWWKDGKLMYENNGKHKLIEY